MVTPRSTAGGGVHHHRSVRQSEETPEESINVSSSTFGGMERAAQGAIAAQQWPPPAPSRGMTVDDLLEQEISSTSSSDVGDDVDAEASPEADEALREQYSADGRSSGGGGGRGGHSFRSEGVCVKAGEQQGNAADNRRPRRRLRPTELQAAEEEHLRLHKGATSGVSQPRQTHLRVTLEELLAGDSDEDEELEEMLKPSIRGQAQVRIVATEEAPTLNDGDGGIIGDAGGIRGAPASAARGAAEAPYFRHSFDSSAARPLGSALDRHVPSSSASAMGRNLQTSPSDFGSFQSLPPTTRVADLNGDMRLADQPRRSSSTPYLPTGEIGRPRRSPWLEEFVETGQEADLRLSSQPVPAANRGPGHPPRTNIAGLVRNDTQQWHLWASASPLRRQLPAPPGSNASTSVSARCETVRSLARWQGTCEAGGGATLWKSTRCELLPGPLAAEVGRPTCLSSSDEGIVAVGTSRGFCALLHPRERAEGTQAVAMLPPAAASDSFASVSRGSVSGAAARPPPPPHPIAFLGSRRPLRCRCRRRRAWG
eukprot:GHVT01070105.1.p1 GENE.GHVT01070105.1~~GHVT01070105.1.p1  ORF type:complete len:540 (-),score=102.80 GHVT01070105.1:2-1621(-)